MKKIKTILAMSLLAMMTVAFTSCEDEAIAYDLEGTWEGNMSMSHRYNGITYDATYSVLHFDKNPYKYAAGDGYWIDYYGGSYWGRNYVANHIKWSVDDEIIKIKFIEDDYTIRIRDYGLNDNHFYGVIYDGDTKVKFSLRHIDSPKWDSYYYGDYDYYYAKANPAVMDSGIKVPYDERPQRVFGRKAAAAE